MTILIAYWHSNIHSQNHIWTSRHCLLGLPVLAGFPVFGKHELCPNFLCCAMSGIPALGMLILHSIRLTSDICDCVCVGKCNSPHKYFLSSATSIIMGSPIGQYMDRLAKVVVRGKRTTFMNAHSDCIRSHSTHTLTLNVVHSTAL